MKARNSDKRGTGKTDPQRVIGYACQQRGSAGRSKWCAVREQRNEPLNVVGGVRKLTPMPQRAATIETLPEDLRETIEEDVRAGEFADADEAIRKAILAQHERLALRRSVLEADTAIARGEYITPEESRARSVQLLEELKHRDG